MNTAVTTRFTASPNGYSDRPAVNLMVLSSNLSKNDQSDKWESAIDSIAKLQWLKRNWDGDRAKVPSESLVLSVVRYAKYLKSKNTPAPTRVSPIEDGGIALEWNVDGEFRHCEFLVPYIVETFTSIPGQPPRYEEIDFRAIFTPAYGEYKYQLSDKWSQLSNAPALLSRANMCTEGF